MKFLHTADWHIGRTINGFSLLEEQKYAFEQIKEIAKNESVDALIIAGDLYDRSIPSVEAVTTFNEMLTDLVINEKIPVYAISGNHDGAKRLNFGRDFFADSNFYLSTNIEEAMKPVETEDTQYFLLPFIDPSDARVYYKNIVDEDDDTVKSYTKISDAVRRIVSDMREHFVEGKNHVLVTHFAVSKKGEESDDELKQLMLSETTSTVGGLATLTHDIFKDFDYVALGHIHTHKASPSERVVYSGSPVIFNSKEAKLSTQKGIYIVDDFDGKINTKFINLKVKKPFYVLNEDFETLTSKDFYKKYSGQIAWYSIQLKDYDRKAMEGINIRARLEDIYGTDIVELSFEESSQDNKNQSQNKSTYVGQNAPEVTINNFYEEMTGQKPSDFQEKVIEDILIDIRKER
ncbi:exonuclease sbcCD subunit D [Floricoccus penangensis]|uniref:Nuclease SbcCD subunit D n=1 Tax=Floricoccus penangensis TaxID=1859475 RepID=A0A9Q5P0A7_9LACT|nr:exonuclease SbcCD subunit D [Floricoccus penangensis]OFI46091.1 exonuclease sbcCD subunit D [Floricoccus penangensis]